MLLKKLYYRAFQKYPTKEESFSSKMVKILNKKKVIRNYRRAWKISDSCNDYSHHNPSKEKRSIEGVLGLLAEFAKEECGIELEVPSSEESSIFKELSALKADILEGGFSDRPDTCPHCNNFIGYIDFMTDLDCQFDVQGTMAWRKENDRNYCPFCLKKDYIPAAVKQIRFPINLEIEEYWVDLMDQVIRQEGGQVYLANHMKWERKITCSLYVAEFGGSGELDISSEPIDPEKPGGKAANASGQVQ